MKHTFFVALATILSSAAAFIAKGPCWVYVHQEDLPEELLTKN